MKKIKVFSVLVYITISYKNIRSPTNRDTHATALRFLSGYKAIEDIMRLYKIERIVFADEHEEFIELESIIVPEEGLGEYDFQTSEFVGTLAEEFELQRENSLPLPKDKTKVLQIKKD